MFSQDLIHLRLVSEISNKTKLKIKSFCTCLETTKFLRNTENNPLNS